MFIDIHAHAYRLRPPFVCGFPTAEELLALYDANDIEMGFVLPIVNPEIYFPQANEDILEMVEQHPGRLRAFCNVDPRCLTNSCDAPLWKVLGHYRDRGCLGVGEIMPTMPMRHPMVQNLLKCAEQVGLPVTWDNSDQEDGDFGLYDEAGLPQLEHSLARFPKLSFIGHGPVFWYELGELETPGGKKPGFYPGGGQTHFRPPSRPIEREGVLPKLFRYFDNLYGELSDAYSIFRVNEDYGPKFLTEFQDRLFFGTDTCSPRHSYLIRGLLLDWRERGLISETVFKKIARENAIRFFGL